MDDVQLHGEIVRQRESLLRRLQARLELPMALLGLAWLALVVVDRKRDGTRRCSLSTVVWRLFVADFALKSWPAPRSASPGRGLRPLWP